MDSFLQLLVNSEEKNIQEDIKRCWNLNTVIEVHNLVKEFNGCKILDNVSFNVDRGEVFGYLGPNGAGKTTTLRILLGLIKPTSGEVFVLGENPLDNSKLRMKIGVLLEDNGLYNSLTAYENLDLYARLYGLANAVERRRRIIELLDFIGLYERRDDKVGYLSRGMKRKLAIARAILHHPEIVFMDEPTSNLDPKTRVLIRDLILELAHEEKTTMFIISHNLNDVEKVCSSVAILVNGRIIARGPIDELKKQIIGRELAEVSLEDVYMKIVR